LDARTYTHNISDLSEVFFLKWEIKVAQSDAYHHPDYWHSGGLRTS